MNLKGRTVDTTYLSLDTAEDRGFIHRDYIAHCFRWSHVVKRLYERKAFETARIMDIGCGRELPFAKTLYSSKLLPAMYYGIDAGPINNEDLGKINRTSNFRHKVWEKTNFLQMDRLDVYTGDPANCAVGDLNLLPNLVTCFEVLEHVEPEMMIAMIEHMKHLTSPDVRIFISTPCWNRRDCAANHVNEMLYESLGAVFEKHGLHVENVYGTFASIRDYEHLLNTEGIASAFQKLREYYDTNVLSCIFAPLFPANSRNALWELRKAGMIKGGYEYKFKPIEEVTKPWGSSAKWEDMAK